MRPPFPAVQGFLRGPSIVSDVGALANLPWIMRRGPAARPALGVADSAGSKLTGVRGHLNRPDVYEAEVGYPRAAFLTEEAGGLPDGCALKAVIPGGASVPVLTAAECEGDEGSAQDGSLPIPPPMRCPGPAVRERDDDSAVWSPAG